MKIICFGRGYDIYDVHLMEKEREFEIVELLEWCDTGLKLTVADKVIYDEDIDFSSFEFDYILIMNGAYARYEEILINKGILNNRILSIYRDEAFTLRILGQKKNLVFRMKGKREEYVSYKIGKKNEPAVKPGNVDERKTVCSRLINVFEKQVEDRAGVDQIYHIGKNWQGHLLETRKEFYHALELSVDVKNTLIFEMIDDFFRTCMGEGMAGGKAAYAGYKVTDEYSLAKSLETNMRIWYYGLDEHLDIKELADNGVGGPLSLELNGISLHINTFFNHSRMCSFKRFLQEEEHPVIAEIGGGYGGCGYFISKDILNATYINFDIPEILLVSSYYLSTQFPNKKILCYEGIDMDLSPERIKSYDIVLLPNFMIEKFQSDSVDLFFNTISMGEMEINIVNNYIEQVGRISSKYFYHENLIEFHSSYSFNPSDLYEATINQYFDLFYKSADRWPFFNLETKVHRFMENLYIKK
ncbi:putative sugar O-methyltransferase [Psychromonas sp. SA13A]|uniref:putative sugar O-methyltransferase n=1 Tax=Psychromonas sp. SA13A TaxID=2686346 RepID=UPI00140D137F|nr:putative sugar O-methyltransferase [Psychromonas sp. SA13A]